MNAHAAHFCRDCCSRHRAARRRPGPTHRRQTCRSGRRQSDRRPVPAGRPDHAPGARATATVVGATGAGATAAGSIAAATRPARRLHLAAGCRSLPPAAVPVYIAAPAAGARTGVTSVHAIHTVGHRARVLFRLAFTHPSISRRWSAKAADQFRAQLRQLPGPPDSASSRRERRLARPLTNLLPAIAPFGDTDTAAIGPLYHGGDARGCGRRHRPTLRSDVVHSVVDPGEGGSRRSACHSPPKSKREPPSARGFFLSRT